MIYKLLENPTFYSFVQWAFSIGGTGMLDEMFAKTLPELSSCTSVLDVGCGPKSKFSQYDIHPTGFDLSLEYIKAFTAAENQPGCVGSIGMLPFSDKVFDAVLSFGLFHHVPDEIAAQGISEMLRVCNDHGRVIIWDAVMPKQKLLRPQAWLIRRLDRGEFVRHEKKFVKLLPDKDRWTVSRFTYNRITGVELLVCEHGKDTL